MKFIANICSIFLLLFTHDFVDAILDQSTLHLQKHQRRWHNPQVPNILHRHSKRTIEESLAEQRRIKAQAQEMIDRINRAHARQVAPLKASMEGEAGSPSAGKWRRRDEINQLEHVRDHNIAQVQQMASQLRKYAQQAEKFKEPPLESLQKSTTTTVPAVRKLHRDSSIKKSSSF